MGHKAMVAFEVSDDVYNLHFSPWGASGLRLQKQISENTPLGGEKDEPDYINGVIANIDSENSAGRLAESQDTSAIKPEPTMKNITIREAAKGFHYLYTEAFYIVSENYKIRSYLPVPYLGDENCLDTETGLLIEVTDIDEYNHLFNTTRSDWRGLTIKEWKNNLKQFNNQIPPFSPILPDNI